MVCLLLYLASKRLKIWSVKFSDWFYLFTIEILLRIHLDMTETFFLSRWITLNSFFSKAHSLLSLLKCVFFCHVLKSKSKLMCRYIFGSKFAETFIRVCNRFFISILICDPNAPVGIFCSALDFVFLLYNVSNPLTTKQPQCRECGSAVQTCSI